MVTRFEVTLHLLQRANEIGAGAEAGGRMDQRVAIRHRARLAGPGTVCGEIFRRHRIALVGHVGHQRFCELPFVEVPRASFGETFQ
ncbi:hypothetical protein D3C71_2021870 [compost metagenome]